MQAVSDFSRGKVSGNILRLAMPMVVAQLVNVLYNIVCRWWWRSSSTFCTIS